MIAEMPLNEFGRECAGTMLDILAGRIEHYEEVPETHQFLFRGKPQDIDSMKMVAVDFIAYKIANTAVH